MNGEQLSAGFGVAMLRPNELSRLSELYGTRKVRDAQLYHTRIYPVAGTTSLEFFRVSGAQQDYSGGVGLVANISNMVTSGKLDEPFLIEKIGLYWDNGSIITGAAGINASETMAVLRSGRFVLEVNGKPVFERAPIGLLGEVDAFEADFGSTATLLAFASSKLAPQNLDPMIFMEENITIRAELRWTANVTVTAASNIGIYLMGKKYEKA